MIVFDQEKRSSEPLAPEQFLSAFFLLMLGVVIATGKTHINLNHIQGGGHIGPKWETTLHCIIHVRHAIQPVNLRTQSK